MAVRSFQCGGCPLWDIGSAEIIGQGSLDVQMSHVKRNETFRNM
jgi:hypothetical protein